MCFFLLTLFPPVSKKPHTSTALYKTNGLSIALASIAGLTGVEQNQYHSLKSLIRWHAHLWPSLCNQKFVCTKNEMRNEVKVYLSTVLKSLIIDSDLLCLFLKLILICFYRFWNEILSWLMILKCMVQMTSAVVSLYLAYFLTNYYIHFKSVRIQRICFVLCGLSKYADVRKRTRMKLFMTQLLYFVTNMTNSFLANNYLNAITII